MKLSKAPKHFAPRKKMFNHKNHPGHRSYGGERSHSPMNSAAAIVRLLFGTMSRRTRRVFMMQERANAK